MWIIALSWLRSKKKELRYENFTRTSESLLHRHWALPRLKGGYFNEAIRNVYPFVRLG